MLGVNDVFPDFNLTGVEGDQIVEVDSTELPDTWKVIYFYPKDFTFICPTEITGMDALMREVDVYGISGDNEYCKLAWKGEHEDLNKIEHILLADRGLNLSEELGIVDYDEGVCLRATFIIDPENIVKHVSCNELDTGRSADEILRTLGALQAGGLTGCQWKPGDEFVG